MRIVGRVLLRLFDRAARAVGTLLGRGRLWSQGVDVGEGLCLYGAPIVACADGARIRLGNRVVLCSRSSDTALGVAHPVVLRAVAAGATIEIGDDTGISGGSICAAVSVRIGQRCLLGADVMVTDTDFHAHHAAQRREAGANVPSAAVWIGDDVFIGARAVVLKGVRIGDGAVVGCAAVVTRDVAPGAVVAGNPAREIVRKGPA